MNSTIVSPRSILFFFNKGRVKSKNHLGSLVVLNKTTKGSLSGTKCTVKHVHKTGLLVLFLEAQSDVQRS